MVPQPREEKEKEGISQRWVVLSEVTLENKGASSGFQEQGKGAKWKKGVVLKSFSSAWLDGGEWLKRLKEDVVKDRWRESGLKSRLRNFRHITTKYNAWSLSQSNQLKDILGTTGEI